MDKKQLIVSQLKKQGVLPLFYHPDAGTCVKTIGALYAAGIRSIEFTNRGDAARTNFAAIVAARNEGMKDLLLGVGTVFTAEQADYFLKAGADFLISPVFDKEVYAAALAANALWIPGCMTPTEIEHARKSGCHIVKLFPGNLLQPGFVSAVRPVFPNMDFIVTGGVDSTRESIAEWYKAGVCAVGLGSKLITAAMLNAEDFFELEKATRTVLHIIQSIKS